jgi:hypothetical protein
MLSGEYWGDLVPMSIGPVKPVSPHPLFVNQPDLMKLVYWTGQIVFDKRGNNGLNLAALHLANHMMTNPDMYGFLSYGDKDTFVSLPELVQAERS